MGLSCGRAACLFCSWLVAVFRLGSLIGQPAFCPRLVFYDALLCRECLTVIPIDQEWWLRLPSWLGALVIALHRHSGRIRIAACKFFNLTSVPHLVTSLVVEGSHGLQNLLSNLSSLNPLHACSTGG